MTIGTDILIDPMITAGIPIPPAPEPRPAPRRSNRWLLWLIIIAMVVGGGIALWEEVLEDRFVARRWGVVEAGEVYRSGQVSPYLIKETLHDNHIAVVVDLNGKDDSDPRQRAEAAAIAELGIEAHRFGLSGDGTGDIHAYARAIEEIVKARQAGKPILVHCSAGTQRTGGVIAAYRVLVQKRDPHEAYRELLAYDWHPKKDAILLTYLNGHMEELAGLLVQSGVIERVPAPVPVVAP